MRNRLLSAGLALGLVWGTANGAVINLVDGWSGVYDPANTYVPTGMIGPEIYSFLFNFTDEAHQFDVTLQAPVGLTGVLSYAVTTALDAGGVLYFGNDLLAGETVAFTMGGIVGAAPPGAPQALTFGIFPATTTTYQLDGNSAILVSDFGSSGSGSGSGNGNGSGDPTGQVATPAPLLLLLSVLAGLALRSIYRPRESTFNPAPTLASAS